ncbi:hypothetical protein FAZ15_10175 [Sphingobacterium olei]|uniref:DUF8202 domain-containing protein n=1 Tax=Sphingobacterium olei TaxID=2571155 RepID=A0A4U0NZM3_9SPHI|nr:hypothetical protein [Sphingobacterium olei]TJZ60367.1 hypothetical protein FAZ15_10175 [Sphingobacterium olei]
MRKTYNLKIGWVTALFFAVLTSAFGQFPGGVSTGLAAWYKGDVGLAGTFWTDQSGNAYNLERTSAPAGESLINFNPVASFEGVTAHQFNNLTPKLLWPVGNATPTTYYYVAKNNAATANRAVFGIGASGDATGFHSGQQPTTGAIATRGTASFANNTGTAMVPAPPNWDITQPNRGLNLVRTGYDGGGATGRNYIAAQSWAEVINTTNVSPTYANTAAFRIGSSGANSVFWSGDVAEVVVFSGKHDPAEYNKIESYLALKYGITKQGDYVDANNNIIYNDATYINNIGGIGRDDASGLHQKQSMSQNAGNQLLIGNGSSLFATNADNTNNLTDGQFLVWGDNGLQKQLLESLIHTAPGGEINSRFSAIWRVQNTNTVGTVTVAWPVGITNLHLVQSADAVFDNTDTFTPMTAVVTVNGVDYNTATITLSNGAYFTFAGYMMAPGGVAGQGFWVRSDMAGDIATAWQDHSTNADDIPALGAWALSTADGAHNFHPYTTDYSTTKNFYNASTLLNPGGGDNPMPHSIFSAVRPTTNGTGRITGMGTTGGTTYGSNPSLATSSGTPLYYDYDAVTTSETFGTPFTLNATSLFSAVADNSIANGGGSSFAGGELTLGLNGAYEDFTYTNSSHRFEFNGPYLRVGYSTFGTGAGVFPGDIMEVIWYSRALTPNEQSRVNSYLAIKNGVTLNEDYLKSDSDVVFSLSTNSGYIDNIFGLGFNAVSGLTQRQSRSINDGQKLIIGAGSSLFDNNAANTNDLTEGQFLLVGDNGLKQALSEPLVYTAGANGETNFRFASIWKAQNTNSVGQVTVAWPAGINNLYLVQSTNAVFDNTDTFTPMTGTVTVNGVDYNTATVTFNDGDYFTFAGYQFAPGGVVDPDFWVKSDDAGAIETAWKDHSTYANDIPVVGTWTLTPADRAHNFHPYTTGYTGSKYFSNLTSVLNPTNGQLDNVSHSIFSAVRPTSAGTGRIIGIDDDGNGAEPGFSIEGGRLRLYKFSGGANADQFDEEPFKIGAANIVSGIGNNPIVAGGTSTSAGGERVLGVNGVYKIYPNTSSSNRFHIQGQRLRVGDGAWTAPGPFPGDIMEVVWYKRPLTANEQSRVNSYLALKNGATLAENYLTANSSTVWDITTNAGYNNNIFGVVRDNTSGLHQKQAASTGVNQKLVIGHGSSLFESNADNTNDLIEGQFLLTGDNGLKQGLSVPLAYLTGSNGETNFRFESVWKVQNTGNVGTVTVAWPVGVGNMYLVRSTDETFDDTDNFVPMDDVVSINGQDYNTATITFDDGDFFTFAGFGYAPGGVAADLAIWHRADIGIALSGTEVSTWDDMSPNGYQVSQMGTAALPSFGAASQEFNFNPSVNFTATNQVIGQRSESILTTNTFDIFSVLGNVSAGTTFFGIGRDNVTNSGTNWDSPHFRRNGDIIHRDNTGGGLAFRDPVPTYETVGAITRIAYSRFNVDELNRSINGSNFGATMNLAGGNNTAWVRGGQYFGTNSGAATGMGGDDGGFTGSITEKVVYDRNLTPEERDRVNSYLAIKYGVTLRNDIPAGGNHTGTFDYLNAAGNIVWSGNTNPDYHNDVIGLAREDIGLFNQRVSTTRNVVSSGRLIVTTTNDFVSANDDAGRTNFTGNSQYIMFGDNAATGETEATTDPCTGLPLDPAITRANKVWRVETTSNPEPIWLQADLNDYTFNSSIEIWVADDENFSTNLVRLPAASYAGGLASFNFLFTEGVKYMTFAGIVSPSDCDVCTGGTFVFKTGRSWNTLAERTNNVMDPEIIGSTDQGDLIVNMSADYPVGVEYGPNAYPRPYGRWFLSRRRDNQNVEVTHSVNLNQTVAGASFQISNINTYLKNANKFTIIGYDCDDNVVMPKITHAANPTTATTYEIVGNQVVGTKAYRGLTFLHSTANVRFNRPIERIEIVFDVERTNARQTLRSLDIGDISFECATPLPPTVDNVTMIQDFTQSEEVPSCIETTMRLRFINSNCDTRTVNVSQTLPAGLEFVEGTYNDSEFGSPTPYTYNANTFTLNGLELPSGTTFLYINVRSTDGTTTVYNTSSDYTVTETSNSYSSINPAAGEFSTVGFVASSFTAPDLNFLYEVDATCLDEGDQVTYTLNFDNQDPEITGATLKVYYELGQDITSVTFNNGTSGVLGFDPTGESYIEIDDLVIPNGESSITVTLDITSEIFTDEDAASSFFELVIDPDNPCSVENPSMLSNVITLEACPGVDPEVCTEEVEGSAFSSNGGVPITFNQPATNYGFQFDIHSLDNSFNMEINGVQLATQEIEFQSAGTSGINVRFADGDEYETNTAAIWQMTGNASAPLIRVVIAPNGNVTMYGSKTSGGELHLLELSNGNSFNAITWNDGAPNTIVATQSVVGSTYIYGRGSGLNSVPCPQEDYCVTGDCNPNTFLNTSDPNTIEYDNMVSAFHNTMMRDATTGALMVWGQSMAHNGSHVLVPTEVNSTNYPALTGNILKFTSGGNNSSQNIVLTTDGLFVWGLQGRVIHTDLTSSNAFQSVSVGTYGINGGAPKADGLPDGVAPEDVKMLFGSFGKLALSTCAGEVWVLVQDANLYGDGATSSAANHQLWHRVHTNATTTLDNVVAVRGNGGGVLMALTATGEVYTWGTGTRLGDGSAATDRAFASPMTLPTGVTPKMIGVTNRLDNSTYYILGTAGNLYSMGEGSQRQLGNFSTTSSNTWIQAQQSATPGDYLTNVVWISPQEHDSNYASINVLTENGRLWAWGGNHQEMLGGPTNPMDPTEMPGSIPSTDPYDIGKLNWTDTVIAVETGGHTSMTVKDNSKKYGYVGHRINGSMGDGSTVDENENEYNFGDTPEIDLCGAPAEQGYCTQPGATGTPTEFTKVGVADRIGMTANWPQNIPNGFIAIESENKGFVITRLTTVQINALDAVEGMLVYDTDEACIKLYNGTTWNCIQRGCNE